MGEICFASVSHGGKVVNREGYAAEEPVCLTLFFSLFSFLLTA